MKESNSEFGLLMGKNPERIPSASSRITLSDPFFRSQRSSSLRADIQTLTRPFLFQPFRCGSAAAAFWTDFIR